jgi:hypothetical protein
LLILKTLVGGLSVAKLLQTQKLVPSAGWLGPQIALTQAVWLVSCGKPVKFKGGVVTGLNKFAGLIGSLLFGNTPPTVGNKTTSHWCGVLVELQVIVASFKVILLKLIDDGFGQAGGGTQFTFATQPGLLTEASLQNLNAKQPVECVDVMD